MRVFLVGLILSLFLYMTVSAQSNGGLKDFYQNYFPIGVAVSPALLASEPEARLIRKEFNSLTAENAMKMGPMHPGKELYRWEPADKIVAFAGQNAMKVRGHTLCWHNQTPGWFFKNADGKEIGKEELLSRLKEHIFAVAGRYKGRIYAWDVVNEVISDDDGEIFRNSDFYRIAGEEFISKAFEYAHEADPLALLFYNDYNTERPGKRLKIYNMLKKMLDAKVPIHGMGLQAHWSVNHPERDELEKTITLFASLGLQIQITELDISVYQSNQDPALTALSGEMEAKQSAQYKMVFEVFRKYKDQITGVTFWNLSDRSSWLDNFPVRGRKNYPLLFDKNLLRKKAYGFVTDFK